MFSDPHPERTHAMRVLRNHGIDASVIYGVCAEELPEAILFLSRSGSARTAWLSRKDGQEVCHDEPGFLAFPSHPQSV